MYDNNRKPFKLMQECVYIYIYIYCVYMSWTLHGGGPNIGRMTCPGGGSAPWWRHRLSDDGELLESLRSRREQQSFRAMKRDL